MKNFQITAVEDGKKYWVSRSMATRSELIVHDDNDIYILVNKRGDGVPDFKHCWNIPCGYLEYDVTCAENATKELLEETGVFIAPFMWEFLGIEDEPQCNKKQNVTAVFQLHITKESFERFVENGAKMMCDGGEENEVEEVLLMPLTNEEILSREWAFDHKNRLANLMNLYNNN